MSQTQIFSDWKKTASQASSRNTNKDQQEQAFMNLAYGYVSQKAGKLMEDPHRLGFEIVYSNDDGSKQAGMFAFRVGRTLISVPAIFINNDVKGTELMYEHDTKLVRPLSVDWADYIISKYQNREGSQEDPAVTGRMNSGMRLEQIANPRMVKAGSADAAWEAVFADLEHKSDALPDVLPEFLLDAGESAMTKLAAAIEASLPFAEAIAHLPEELYLPQAEVTKEAGEKTPDLEVYLRHFPLTKISKDQNEDAHKRGFFLWENRPEHDLKPVIRQAEDLLSEISETGLYDIVTAKGDGERAWVLNEGDLYNYGPEVGSTRSYNHENFVGSKNRILIWEKDNTRCSCHKTLWGNVADGENGNTFRWSDAGLPEKPSTGKTYYAIRGLGGDAFGPFKIQGISEREDGVSVLTLASRYSDDETTVAYINPDFTGVEITDHTVQVFGEDIRWIEVASEKSKYGGWSLKDSKIKPGGKEDILSFLAKADLRKVTMEKETDTPNFRILNNEEPEFDDIDGVNAVVKAASAYGISAEDALWLHDEAKSKGSASIWVDSSGFEKSAAQAQGTTMSLINSPNYQVGYDNELRVNQETPQSWDLATATSQPPIPQRRLGDAYDPTLGTSPGNENRYLSEEAVAAGVQDSDIFDQSPEDVAAMYTGSNIPNLFQHGTVGMLVSTYDSSSMINKYIPKLEEGLDHFGRILFLFYWKPQDFEKLYGADDLSNLEQELLSQFKSFGDVLLQLIKKNETPTGSVPTP